LLFELISQRYERGATLLTSNLPFDEWTEVFGSERLTGAPLGRLTHHVNILEMNGDSYRLSQSRPERPGAQHHHHRPDRPFGPMRLGPRQLCGEREGQGADPRRTARAHHAKLADFCAAPWQVFTPPLTGGMLRTGRSTDSRFGCKCLKPNRPMFASPSAGALNVFP
jgi:hypothetical protein